MRRSMMFAVVLLAAVATTAAGQQPAPTPLRGYLIGGGGLSIGLPEMSAMLSAEAAENVRPDIQVYLTATFYDDVMSEEARDMLAAASAAMTSATGTTWEFSGRDKARSVSLGVKYLVPTASGVRPYIGGGFGVINLRRVITEQRLGTVTDAYLAQFGAPDGLIDPTQSNTNRPMGELAGGVGFVVRRAYVDFGFRYRTVFHSPGQVNLSQAGVSLGLKF